MLTSREGVIGRKIPLSMSACGISDVPNCARHQIYLLCEHYRSSDAFQSHLLPPPCFPTNENSIHKCPLPPIARFFMRRGSIRVPVHTKANRCHSRDLASNDIDLPRQTARLSPCPCRDRKNIGFIWLSLEVNNDFF